MATPTAVSSVPSKEQDWADISDDDDNEPTPVVKVDSLDLNSLSLQDDKGKAKGIPSPDPRVKLDAAPAKSLADRISLGDATSEKKEDKEDKASATPPPKAREEKKTDKNEEDTNLIQTKYEVAVKLQDLQADPNSPLYSVKSFEELGLYVSYGNRTHHRHPNLLKGIYGMKFQKPSKVQERALPLLVANP